VTTVITVCSLLLYMICVSQVTGGGIAGYSGKTVDWPINLLASVLVGGINFVNRSVCIGFC